MPFVCFNCQGSISLGNKSAKRRNVKSVHIRSFSGPYFLAFGLNMERYLRSAIVGKCGPEKLRIRIILTQCMRMNVSILQKIGIENIMGLQVLLNL